jgi:hypothetical protein
MEVKLHHQLHHRFLSEPEKTSDPSQTEPLFRRLNRRVLDFRLHWYFSCRLSKCRLRYMATRRPQNTDETIYDWKRNSRDFSELF